MLKGTGTEWVVNLSVKTVYVAVRGAQFQMMDGLLAPLFWQFEKVLVLSIRWN